MNNNDNSYNINNTFIIINLTYYFIIIIVIITILSTRITKVLPPEIFKFDGGETLFILQIPVSSKRITIAMFILCLFQ